MTIVFGTTSIVLIGVFAAFLAQKKTESNSDG